MFISMNWKSTRMWFALCLSLAFFAVIPVMARETAGSLRATHIGRSSIFVAWEPGPFSFQYDIYIQPTDDDKRFVATTQRLKYTFRGLIPGKQYNITVSDGLVRLNITVTTKEKLDDEQFAIRDLAPPQDTCRQLPTTITVTGYKENTRCQVVDEQGVGRSDLIKRGVISAVDVWNYVPDNVEVCFRNAGDLVLMDADYAPRMVMELESYTRDGMTCGKIDRAGTVVLLAAAAPAETTTTSVATATLPTVESIPLDNCQIKLVETLFLRAEPAGEIIGLVWLNSEVPAFEINGYWYKIEFEGKTGYISRYHRQVLWGNCG